jgi:integrase
MRGSIVKRGNGYSVVVELDRDPVTQKRRQKWYSGFRTRKEAEKELTGILGTLHAGTFVEPSKQTLAGFLDDWLDGVEPTIRAATYHSYERNLKLHVRPRLGSVQLRRVDAGMLNAVYAALLADGKRSHGGGGLSPRTVRYIHTILHRAFRDAVRWGRLARNPADAADPPRASASARPAMTTWTAGELRAFLDHIQDHRLYAAFVLLATTGMRRGECLGLRWPDVDLVAARLSIVQTVICVHHEIRIGSPKTAKGRWTVALDPGTVAVLRAHRKRQLAERLLMGRRLHRPRPPLLPPRRWAAAPRAVLPDVRRTGGEDGPAHHPAARPAALLGNPGALGRRPPEGGPGAPRPRRHRDHPGRLQPRHRGPARRCGLTRSRAHSRHGG